MRHVKYKRFWKSFGRQVIAEAGYIPGVIGEDITAIETICQQVLINRPGYFVYGMQPNTETFLDLNGELRERFFCDWLTELFGIP